MTEPQLLIIRKKRLDDETLVVHAKQLSQTLKIDPYGVRLSLIGEGFSVFLRGQPDLLLEAGNVLSSFGYQWCIADIHQTKSNPLHVKRFECRESQIAFEGPFGKIELDRGAKVLAVLASLQSDILEKLMRKTVFQGGKTSFISDEEKYHTILMSNPVLDLYLISGFTKGPETAEDGPLRIMPGKFDPSSLGDQATTGTSQNIDHAIRLIRKYAGQFYLDLCFGLSQLPSCAYETAHSDAALIANMHSIANYGRYLIQFYRHNENAAPDSFEKPSEISTSNQPISFAQTGTAAGLGAAFDDKSAASLPFEEQGQGDKVPQKEFLPPPPIDVEDSIKQRFFRKESIAIAVFIMIFFIVPVIAAMSGTRIFQFFVEYIFGTGVFWLMAAAGLIYAGVHFLRLKYWIENTPTSKARSAALGMVEMKGRCERAYNLISPLTMTPCIFYRVRKYVKRGQFRRGGEWSLASVKTSSSIPFYLSDDTGKVMVDPTKADVKASHKKVFQGEMRPFWEPASIVSSDTKYIEEIIPEGSMVYVLGFAVSKQREETTLQNRVTEKLRMLKQDKAAMMRYDANHDGKIDMQEWESARADMERETLNEMLAMEAVQHKQEAQIVIKKPNIRGLPFVISDSSEERLTTKYIVLSGLFFLGAVISIISAIFQMLK